MEALESILTRRSTRRMKPEIPDKKLIEKVIAAGRAAPSGSNSQKTRLIVITRKKVLDQLAELVQREFAEMELTDDMYVSLKSSITRSKEGNYVFHYNAPVLIVTTNKKGYGNAMADSACVLENMMIAANALDLGSCWINQLHWLTDHALVRDCMKQLGMEDDEYVTGGLILGYGADGTPERGTRKPTGNPVSWIE
ncbi:MAG: nitroreductase [Solobacterium sp.]|nr:nitroreductase [Solobacterium sp.]